MLSQDHEGFCSDYLVVKPEAAGFFELVALLWSHKIGERKFLLTPEGKELRGFKKRWIIFLSVILQKFFLLIRKPLAFGGYCLLVLLSLLATHGGFFRLLFDFIRGKVKIPDAESETFRSLIAYLDTRLEKLDPKIKIGHPNYNGALSIMASKLAYENAALTKSIVKHHWQMDILDVYKFWNDFQGTNSTHAFMFHSPDPFSNLTVVSFTGTNPFDAYGINTDLDISWCELQKVGKVHSGFMKALGLQKGTGWPKEIHMDPTRQFAYYTIRQQLRDIVRQNERTKFIVTGHSLGGALAILFVFVLMLHEEEELLERLEGVYTFGQPRVGDERFGEFMVHKMKAYKVKHGRFVYGNDIVPRVPFDDTCFFYKHFSPCLYYNSLYKGKVLENEPNKNYFSPLWIIPAHLTALWELIRGFILPFTRGKDYKEGWVLKIFRVFGLLIPGVSAHGPQDYCNLTRLGPALLSHIPETQPYSIKLQEFSYADIV